MEAVGAASSLLAVITAAIQSTKIVYDAVRAVRNGPAAAQRLAKTISDLLQLLSLFERFGPRLEAISEQNGRDTAEYLRKKLLECERRMNEIQAMLVTFQVRPEYKLGDKLKRSVRLILQEKDFDKWHAEIQVYISLLGVYVGYLDLDTSLANSEDLDIVHSALVLSQTTLVNIEAMQADQKKRDCSAESQLHRIVEGQKAQLQQAEVAQADQQMRFSSLEGKVDELVELIARKMTFFSTQTVDPGTTRSDLMRNLAVEIEDSLLLPPASGTTKRKPTRTLAGMQGTSDCGQGDRPPVNKERGFSHNQSGEGDQEREDLLHKISQSIERLYLTAIPTPAEQQFSNSREIRGGILDILNHVLQSTVYEARLHHYYSNDQARAATVKAELSRTMALLQTTSHLELKNDEADMKRSHHTTTPSIFRHCADPTNARSLDVRPSPGDGLDHELNSASSSCPSTRPAYTPLTQQNFRKRKASSLTSVEQWPYKRLVLPAPAKSSSITKLSAETRKCILSVGASGGRVITQFLQMQHNHPISSSKDRQEQDWEQPEATFRARLVFIPPAHLAYKGQTILEVVQHSWHNGRSILLPSLSFHRIIPWDSEMCRAIRGNSVDTVSRLLTERKFLLTDTTTEGCSLLGVALGFLAVQVVKFLIDHGAEVDAVEPEESWYKDPDRIARPIMPIINRVPTPPPLRPELSASIEECIRLMLGAGADPVQIEVEDAGYTNSFTVSLFLAPAHMVALMLDLGAPYVTSNHQLSFPSLGAPIVHLAKSYGCRDEWWQVREVPSKIILLIKRGVDLTALIDNGNTCLHELLALEIGLTVIPRMQRAEALLRYGSRSRRVIQYMRRLELRDILMLLITAGACVTAVNNSNESVCDVARKYGDEVLWNNVLEECGLDVEKVYSERGTDTCRATSVDYTHGIVDGLTPKLTFEEYLKRREENPLLIKVERMRASAQSYDEELDIEYDSDEEYSQWCEENEIEDCDRIELMEDADDACRTTDDSETQRHDGVVDATSSQCGHLAGSMTFEETASNGVHDQDVDGVHHGDQESESGCWDFEIDAFSDNRAEDNNDTLDDATWPTRLNDDLGNTHPAKTIDHSLAHDFKGSARQPDKGKKKAD